ncbi:phage tail protein [Serratia sp. PAMC26656]|uniref:phage tail protein n=1 Tax=Serratia sp. PAMC26656 TaxID=2775909 RepID=UPI0018F644FF|nr:phage tail protein [Serratia sp. PAMC26656]MBJ7892361.1 phage tail protein [Serratia sp. PAMC26656]
MSKYKAIVTTAGAAKIAAASAGGKQLKITHMAVGDGNGMLPTPNPEQTKLVNEKYRATLNTLTVDRTIDNHIIAELIIPANVGGFWLREMGLYDENGTFIAVSNMAESYKPQLNEGSGRTQTLRMVLIVSNTEAIQIIAGGDTVLATRDFVEDAIKEHEKTRNHPDASTTAKGFVQLSSATTSSDETKAATPKAIKDVNNASVKKAGNLSDLKDKAAARKNLALGTAATRNVGTDSGNLMEIGTAGLGVGPQHKGDTYGNIVEFFRVNATSANRPGNNAYGGVRLPIDGVPTSGYVMVGVDLSAWVGRSTTQAKGVTWARLYTTAFKPTPSEIGAADVRNNFAARMGVARVLSGSNPPTSPGVWSVENCSWTPEKWGTLLCTTNKTALSTARGEGQFLHYLFISHSSKVYVATNVNGNGAGWQQLIGPAGGNLSGPVSSSSWISAASMTAQYHTVPTGMPEGAGDFSGQLNSKAPLYQPNWQWPVTAGGLYVPIVKGVSTRQGQGYPTAVSFGYQLDGSGSFARPCIHARGDNNKDAVWQFNPNDLMLYAPGGIKAGSATLATDGNIMGSRWGNKWLWDAIIEQVNGRVDWGAFGNRTHWWTDGERGWWKDENTGFIYQWTVGPWRKEDEQIDSVGFPMRFPNQCCTVNVGAQAQGDGINNDAVAVVYGWNQEICRVQMNKPAGESSWWLPMRTIIFAIGR